MKKLNAGALALTFAGCFLGAGYVSGQELWQFFGSYGLSGFWGVLLAVLVFSVFGILLLRLAQMTGIEEMDRIVIPWNIPWLRAAAAGLEILFLLGIAMIMSAGVGALCHQFFGIPQWIGCAVFTVLTALVTLGGLGGMVSSFSFSVPILVAATIIFCIVSLSHFGVEGLYLPEESAGGDNPLLGFWGVSAAIFACYNIFGSVGMLAPLGKYTRSRKTIIVGIVLGSFFLLLIAVCVLSAMMVYPASIQAELPMLMLASYLSPVAGYIYGLLLVFAMFGTSVSSLVAVTNFLELRSEKLFKHRKKGIIIVAVLCFLGSLGGFGDLIGVIYPLFGYVSFLFILCIGAHYIRERRKRKKEKS